MTLFITLAVAYFFLMTNVGIELLALIMRGVTYLVIASPMLLLFTILGYFVAKAVMSYG